MADVDLRPMTLGEVLDQTFSLYRENFWLFAGIMALPLLLTLASNICLSVWNSSTPMTIHGRYGGQTINPQYYVNVFIGLAITYTIYFAMLGLAHAATIFAVSDLYLGREAKVRKAYNDLRGKVLHLFGVEILIFLLLIVGFIALIIPAIILACRTAVAVPVAMLEDESPGSSVSRSMDLTKGFAMQIFLIILLFWVLAWVVSIVFQMPFVVLAATQSIHRPGQQLPLIWQILQHFMTFISGVLVGPIETIAFSLMYYNLRVRKEAFDLQHLMASLAPTTSLMEAPSAPTAV